MCLQLKNEPHNLNCEEIGVLMTMVNLPDADYTDINHLSNITNEQPTIIKSAIERLISKDYVIKNNNVYCINKEKMFDYVVGGAC